VVGFLVGVASVFFYPEYVANKTYVSENALSPHWETYRYSREDVQFASSFTKQYQEFQKTLSHQVRSQDEAWNKFVFRLRFFMPATLWAWAWFLGRSDFIL
jgi:hypothetical protein